MEGFKFRKEMGAEALASYSAYHIILGFLGQQKRRGLKAFPEVRLKADGLPATRGRDGEMKKALARLLVVWRHQPNHARAVLYIQGKEEREPFSTPRR